MPDINLRILINAQNTASSVIKGLAGDIGGAQLAVAGLAGGALLAAGIFAGSAVKMAADYQQSMLKVQALTGMSGQQMQDLSNQILQLAPSLGKAPKDMADSLYMLASAGVPANQMMRVMTLTSQAAATGNFDSKIAADALTASVNAMGVGFGQAGNYMDMMTQTVTQGKMEWSQYANVVGKLSVSAKASGISFAEANAALATLTNQGYTARLAGTSLGNMFTQLELKTDTLAKNARKLGLSFDEQRFKSMTLAQQIQYLNQITHGNQSELLKVMNNNSTALKTFDALSGALGTYKNNVNAITKAQQNGKTTAQAFEITQKGFNQTMQQLNAAWQVFMITVGQQLLPVLTQAASAITPLITGFTKWLTTGDNLKNAMPFIIGGLVGLAVIILATVVPVMWAWATATIAATWPLLLVAAIVAAVVGVIVLAYQHWGQIMDWISGKAEQMRLAVEQKHVQMKINADNQTMQQANKVIANIEKERAGILAKLKNCHSESERLRLQHELKALDIQEQGQRKRLAAAEADKKKQLEKQKELHDQMIEAQKNWFLRMMDALGAFFGNIFSAIGTFFHNVFSAVGQWKDGVIHMVQQHIADWIAQFEVWKAKLIARVREFVSNFIQEIIDLKNRAIQRAQDVINGIKQFFENLPGMALQWGQNLINGFINGIKNAAGGIGSALGGILGNIRNMFPHSPAKEGPLRDMNQWGPSFIQQFTGGIEAGRPRVIAAMSTMLSPLVVPAAPSNSGTTAGSTTITINVSGVIGSKQDVANYLVQQISQQLRRTGTMTTWTSGGRV